MIVIGTKERKQRELEERKTFIIEKSKELFFSRGFNNVSIQDICEAIEYGRSAVYNLFSSKEEIYGHIYVEAVKILADLLNTIDIINTDSTCTFEISTDKIFKFYSDYNPYYMALFFFDSNHVACTKIPEHIIEMKHKEKQRAMIPIQRLLRKGIEEKIFLDFNVDHAINTYFISVLGIINNSITQSPTGNSEDLRNTLMEHAKIYERGLRK